MDSIVIMDDVGRTLLSLNVALHTASILLLFGVYRKEARSKNQCLYLLNLSITELLKNLLELILKEISMDIMSTEFLVRACLVVITRILPFLAMFLLTIDRLAASLLHVRYKSVFTNKRIKAAICGTWMTCLIIISVTVGASHVLGGWLRVMLVFSIFQIYVIPIISIVYLLFTIITYIVMFVVFIRSRRNSTAGEQSLFYMFRHSKFYMGILLTSSFLVLTVVPNCAVSTMFFLVMHGVKIDHAGGDLFVMINQLLPWISDTVDGLIYIVLFAPVRKLIAASVKASYNACMSICTTSSAVAVAENQLDFIGSPALVVPPSTDPAEGSNP